MIGKKEIYIGVKNERYDSILRILDEKKIKYEVRAMEEHHVLDIYRGGAVGRCG